MKHDINDTHRHQGVAGVRALTDNAKPYNSNTGDTASDSKPDESNAALEYVDLALDLVPQPWLVADRIPSCNVTLLSGEGSAGKSLLLMQLSAAIVLGK